MRRTRAPYRAGETSPSDGRAGRSRRADRTNPDRWLRIVPRDRAWIDPVPVTNARRSPNDCAREGISPDLPRPAAQLALRRGLATKVEAGEVETASRPFGVLTA
jgi:hypothetical protein